MEGGQKCLTKITVFETCKYPELEKQLANWVILERKKGLRVSTSAICQQAVKFAKALDINQEMFHSSWCFRMMKRNNLTIRTATSIGQKLPADWEAKAQSVRDYMNKNSVDLHPSQLGNMDEIPVTFDLPTSRTVELKGAKEVSVATTGHEKSNFTIMLTVTADGAKLPPLVIFKRKTIPKGNFPKNIVVFANEKGWVNASVMNRKSLVKKEEFRPKSLLIYDACPAHRVEGVKKLVKRHSILAMIPGGLTKKFQPLDLSVNKSFKSKMRNKWE